MSNKMTSEEVLSLMILNSGISVTGTISNFLVILAVLSDRQLRQTGTAVLMVSLSSFDLMLCVVYQPMKIYTINHVPSAMFNTVRRILGYILILGSLNSTFAISMDRFVSICFPYRYVEWTTGKLTFTMIFLTWFFAAAIAFLNEITEMPSPNYYLLVYITLLIVLIISFHVGMCWVARREAKQIARLYPPECQEFSIWSKIHSRRCHGYSEQVSMLGANYHFVIILSIVFTVCIPNDLSICVSELCHKSIHFLLEA